MITRKQAVMALLGTALGKRIAELQTKKLLLQELNQFEESELKGLLTEAERCIERQMS